MSNWSQDYWDRNKAQYPYQTEVGHLTPADLDPRAVREIIHRNNDFLRVPISGTTYWGFQSQGDLDIFLHVSSVRKAK